MRTSSNSARNGGYAHAEVGGDTVVLARLGSVSSVSALRSGVGRVLADSNAGGASAAGSGLAAPGVTPNGTSANSTHNGVQPSKSAAAAPTTSVTGSATTGTNKSTASGSSRSATQSNNRLARALQVCLASARRAAGGRTVEMGASSTYRTAAALVYVFTAATAASSPPAGGTIPAPAVVVVASQGCRVARVDDALAIFGGSPTWRRRPSCSPCGGQPVGTREPLGTWRPVRAAPPATCRSSPRRRR